MGGVYGAVPMGRCLWGDVYGAMSMGNLYEESVGCEREVCHVGPGDEIDWRLLIGDC